MSNEGTLNGSIGEKKPTFGVQQPKKGKNTRKVVTAIAAAVMATAAIAIPTVIHFNKDKTFTVTINYGVAGNTESIKLKQGMKLSDIKAEKVPGYYFAGYCSDEALTNYLDSNTVITEETTIYLSYIPIKYSFTNIPSKVTIRYEGKELSVEDKLTYNQEIEISYEVQAGYQESFSVHGVELIEGRKEGNIYTGRYRVKGFGAEDEQEVSLSINYEEEITQYTVTLVNGEEEQTVQVSYNNPVQWLGEDPTKPADKVYEYRFKGWSTNKESNYEDETLITDLSHYLIKEDTTLYAIYEEVYVEYNISITPETVKKENVKIYKKVNNNWQPIEITDTVHYEDEIKIEYVVDEGYHLNLEKTQVTAGVANENKLAENIYTYTVIDNVTIEYAEEINIYTITLVNEGVTFATLEVEHGSNISPSTPTKQADDVYTYTFEGWYKGEEKLELNNITKGGIYEARYTEEYNYYDITINLISEDEEDITSHISVTDKEGNKITKAHIGQEIFITYSAAIGHESTLSCKGLIKNNASYTVTDKEIEITYTESKIRYTVTFLDYDGTVLGTQPVKYQESADLGYTPTREADDIYTYAFKTWVDEESKEVDLNHITAETTVYASYTETYIEYALTIKAPEGANLTITNKTHPTLTNVVYYGDELEINYTPKEGYDYTYTVTGLNNENKATGEVNVTVTETVKSYQLTLTGTSGTILVTDQEGHTYQNGDRVEHFKTLTITYTASTGHHITNLTGNGVSAELETEDVRNNTEVTITLEVDSAIEISYAEAINEYTVTYINGEEKVTNTVNYGEASTYTGSTPTKDATEDNTYSYTYNFIGWSTTQGGEAIELTNITEDITVYPVFAETKVAKEYSIGAIPNGVTITFVSAAEGVESTYTTGSTLTAESTLHYGDTIKVEYAVTENDFKMTNFVVNNIEVTGGENYTEETGAETGYVQGTITGNITTTFAEDHAYLKFGLNAGKYRVAGMSDTSVENVTIPGSYKGKQVSSVSGSAFNNNKTLKSVTISDGVTSIGHYVFNNCSNITSITLSSTLTSIRAYAFEGCSSLTDMNYLGTLEQWCKISFENLVSTPTYYTHKLVIQGEEKTNLVIPEGVTSIGGYAFYNCSNITSVTLPSTLTSIGSRAFCSCSSLTEINIPEGVTSIGEMAFWGCGSLTNLTLPSTLTSIGQSAFSHCNSLTEITIPEGVTSIEVQAFYGCNSLTSVNLPSTLTSIGRSAFSSCSSLTSITIPTNVTSIGNSAFFGCSNLKTVTIESADIYNALTKYDACGELARYRNEIRVLSSIDDGTNTYLGNTDYTYTAVSEDGYNIYAKQGYTITAYDEDKTTVLNTYKIANGYTASITNPTKDADLMYASYTFAGWVDANGNAIDLATITANTSVYVTWTKTYQEYELDIQTNIQDAETGSFVVFNVTQNKVTSTVHYGDILELRITNSTGYHTGSLTILGAVETEENQYQVQFNEADEHKVSITYTEEVNTYTITIQEGTGTISVTDQEGHTYKNGDSVEHFKTLTITYTATEGHHITNLTGNDISANLNAEDVRTNKTASITLNVTGEVNVTYAEEINVYIIKFYEEDKETLLIEKEVEHGEQVIYTGKDPVKEWDEVYTYSFKEFVTESGETAQLNNITSDLNVYATFSKSAREYTITKPNNVFVNFVSGNEALTTTHTNGDSLTNLDTLHYGDKVTIGYTLTPNYKLKKFTVNGTNATNGQEITITENLLIEFEEELNGYPIPPMPGGTKVYIVRDGVETPVDINDIVTIGEEVIIRYECKPGYHMTRFDVTGLEISESSKVVGSSTGYVRGIVTGQITIIFNEEVTEYTIGEIPQGVTITFIGAAEGISSSHTAGKELTSTDTIHYGDTIKVSYAVTENDFKMTNFVVNGITSVEEDKTNTTQGYIQGIVADNITTIFTEDHIYLNFRFDDTTDTYMCSGMSDKSVRDIIIPSSYKGVAVTSIMYQAFDTTYINCNLRSAVIPDSITSIGYRAFYNNNSLSNLTIGSGVTTIETEAFGQCYSLGNVIINSSMVYSTILTEAGACGGMVEGCVSALRNNIKVLSSIDDGTNSYLNGYVMTVDGEYNVYDLTLEVLSFRLNNDGNSYSVTALNDKALENVTIPSTYNGKNVTMIDGYAFSNCTSLKSVNIPEGVTIIEYSAFKGCSNLTSITIPQSVTRIGMYVFENCSSLTEITIPSKVTEIEHTAFSSCTKLKTVTIESANIYKALTGSNYDICGDLAQDRNEIRVLTSIDDGSNSYLSTNFPYTVTDTVNGNSYKVYAKEGYTLTLYNETGETSYSTNKVAKGYSFALPRPTKPDEGGYTYSFAGWATSANSSSATITSNSYTPTANSTLYAVFNRTSTGGGSGGGGGGISTPDATDFYNEYQYRFDGSIDFIDVNNYTNSFSNHAWDDPYFNDELGINYDASNRTSETWHEQILENVERTDDRALPQIFEIPLGVSEVIGNPMEIVNSWYADNNQTYGLHLSTSTKYIEYIGNSCSSITIYKGGSGLENLAMVTFGYIDATNLKDIYIYQPIYYASLFRALLEGGGTINEDLTIHIGSVDAFIQMINELNFCYYQGNGLFRDYWEEFFAQIHCNIKVHENVVKTLMENNLLEGNGYANIYEMFQNAAEQNGFEFPYTLYSLQTEEGDVIEVIDGWYVLVGTSFDAYTKAYEQIGEFDGEKTWYDYNGIERYYNLTNVGSDGMYTFLINASLGTYNGLFVINDTVSEYDETPIIGIAPEAFIESGSGIRNLVLGNNIIAVYELLNLSNLRTLEIGTFEAYENQKAYLTTFAPIMEEANYLQEIKIYSNHLKVLDLTGITTEHRVYVHITETMMMQINSGEIEYIPNENVILVADLPG